MFNPLKLFSPLPPKPVTLAPDEIDRRYRAFRWQEAMAMTLGYGIFYVCRLAFSATKKSLIDGNWYSSKEIGWVGSAMLFAYAFGKIANGFLADRANLRRFMGFGLFVSALMNFIVGWHVPAMALVVVWFVNGFAQATGASASVVAISRWYPKRERGTFYGIFSMSNNFGEALAYVLTSVVMVYAAKWFDVAPIEKLFHYLETWFVSTPPTVEGHYGNGAAWRSGFWGAAFLGALGVMLIMKFFRDSPESEGLPPVQAWAKEPPDARLLRAEPLRHHRLGHVLPPGEEGIRRHHGGDGDNGQLHRRRLRVGGLRIRDGPVLRRPPQRPRARRGDHERRRAFAVHVRPGGARLG